MFASENADVVQPLKDGIIFEVLEALFDITTFHKSVTATTTASPSHHTLELADRSTPLFLQAVHVHLKIHVLLEWDLHDRTIRQDLLQMSVEVTCNALCELDSTLQTIAILLVTTRISSDAPKNREDMLDRSLHLLEIGRVEQVLDRDILQKFVVVLSLLVFRANLSVIAESKHDTSMHV